MRTLLRSVLAAVLLLACANAAALCPIFGLYRYVGDTATDSQCTDNDIQSAINNASTTCRTNIVITKEHTYTSQALEIANKSIALEGVGDGIPCNYQPGACDPNVGCGGGGGGPPPAPAVTIHGNGNASVLYIHGTSYVTLQSIALTGGGGVDYGGGVHFSGTGSLTLVDSTINLNTASYGGGIQFNGSGGAATLTLGAGTIIDENGAGVHGGGIQINGTARLFALAPYTFIGFNQALNGHGGGIAVVGPARADIGSPGYNGGPVIQFNQAQYGGGIAIDAGPDAGDDAAVRIFSVDANNPVQISSNTASATGGGIWQRPNDTFTGLECCTRINVQFCAFDYRIDDNVAQEGTAIYSDLAYDQEFFENFSGDVELNGSNACGPESPPSLGAVPCAPGVTCNTMNGNAALDSGSNPKPGSVILAQDAGSLTANRLIMRNNAGAHAIRLIDPSASISNCLVADNTLTQEMIRLDNDGNGGATSLDGCTIVNNSNQGAPVIYSAHALTLTDSIIDEQSIVTLNYTGNAADLDVGYLLSNDTSTLPVAPGVIQGEPTYVDAAAHDYHLQATSIGIDYAPAKGGFDLDRVPRDVDLAPVPNNYGTRDIGAYERQYVCTADTVFCNGFEAYQ